MWMILCAALVVFMQAGFAMLEAGCCREGFVSSVLEKNLLDACLAALSWWLLGWGVAYGNVPQSRETACGASGHLSAAKNSKTSILELSCVTAEIDGRGS